MFPFGIDISDLSIKVVQLYKKHNEIRVGGFVLASLPPEVLEHGEVKDADQIARLLRQALKKPENKKIKGHLAVASLPEIKAFLRIIKLKKTKKTEDKDIKEALKIETEQHIPFKLNEVYLDAELISENKKRFKFLVSAVPKKIVEGYLEVLKKAKITPLALEIESIATSRALTPYASAISDSKNKNNLPSTVLIVDLGSKTTNFIIVEQNMLSFTKSVPMASANLTQAIQDALKVDPQKAEKLKRRYGLNTAAYKGKIFQSLQPHLSQLSKEINDVINFYELKSTQKDVKKIEKIILCGGSANLKGLVDFLSLKLKRKVEKGNPWVNLPLEEKELPAIPQKKVLNFTTSIGLALRGAWDESLLF